MVTSLLHDIGKLVLVARLPRLSRARCTATPDAGGADPPRAARAGRRPRARRRRARAPLGPAEVDRLDDRAPPRRGRRRRGRARAPRRHARPLRAGRRRLAERDARVRARRRARRRPSCAPSCTTCRTRPTASRQRQLDPCPLSTRELEVLQAPRPGQGLQADRPRAGRCRRAPCARTCTTSTASSAPSIARRPCLIATERGWICSLAPCARPYGASGAIPSARSR